MLVMYVKVYLGGGEVQNRNFHSTVVQKKNQFKRVCEFKSNFIQLSRVYHKIAKSGTDACFLPVSASQY